MISPFPGSRLPCADDTNSGATFGVGHDQQAIRLGSAKTQESELAIRVVGIGDGDLEGISEDGLGFGEGHAVTPEILVCFFGIPFEFHRPSLSLRGHLGFVNAANAGAQPPA